MFTIGKKNHISHINIISSIIIIFVILRKRFKSLKRIELNDSRLLKNQHNNIDNLARFSFVYTKCLTSYILYYSYEL